MFMKKYLRPSIILFFFLFKPIFSQANRVGMSGEKWLVKKTAHFDIHYSAQQQDLGLYYSQIAETAYLNLSKVFIQSPEKITIVLNDSTDNSNGYATVLPYPLIMIYPVQVTNHDTLSEAGEWSRELLTHEMTHIFQMFPYRGFYNWLRPIYGTIVSPNLLTPSWWKEGMAIELETQFSPQGRSRSDLQNSTVRSLVIDDKLAKFTLAEANETLNTWPYGNRPYFLGSMLMSEIVHDGGLNSIGQIVNQQSGRAPYFIEAPVNDAIGRSYQSQFYQMIENQTRQALNQIQQLKTAPETTGVIVDDNLLSSRHPRFHSATKTLGLIGSKKTGPEILFYKWNENLKKYMPDSLQTHQISGTLGTFEFHPTNESIVFSKVAVVNSKQEFSDLYVFDLQTQKQKQITRGERAREPQYSVSGNDILFISIANGRTEFKVLNLQTELIESIYKADFKDRITQAIDLNANQYLINIRDQNGLQKLILIEKNTKATANLTSEHKQIRFIKKSVDRIYFTSTNNGVSNIYATEDLSGPATAETHLMTGALSFDIDGQKIFATIIGSSGTQVQEIIKRSVNFKNLAPLPEIQNVIANRYQFKEINITNPESIEEDYSVWPKILPHYWFPYLSTSSSNAGVFAQIQTAGQDPLNLHQYQVVLNYETYLKKMGFNFNYLNSVYEWQITASATQIQKIYGVQNLVSIQTNTYALGALPDVFKISDSLSVNFGAIMRKTDDQFLITDHSGGYLQTIYKKYEQKVTQYYPMSGYGIGLRYENLTAQTDLGTRLGDYSQFAGSVLGYFSKWLPEDHSLAFKFDGLYTFEDVSSRFGTSNSQFSQINDSLIPQFATRGYQAGQFYGAQLLTATSEYRFPIKNIHSGSGTDPYFIKTLTGAVVVDGISTKGFGINEFDILTPLTLSEQFWSAGIEARLSTTLGYFIPLNFVLGYYLPFSPAYGKSAQMGLSLQIGGL